MAGAVLAIAVTLYGWAPTGARSQQVARFVSLGPHISAHLMTGSGWEPPDHQVSNLRRLIEVTPDDDPQKPDFWFHLGNACMWLWDHSRDGEPYSHEERQWLFSQAVDAFRAAATFERYDRVDRALYSLARLYLTPRDWRTGDAASARPYIDRLVRDYPTSRYVPLADLLYGDEMFFRDDWAAALAWYSMAAERVEATTLPYALYGKGWCFLKRGDFEAGRFALAEAVRTADEMTQWSWNRVVRRVAEKDLAKVP